VPNLDRVLGGGLLRGTIVMLVGPPGGFANASKRDTCSDW
jgi:predicted ATP-dependent serine protease